MSHRHPLRRGTLQVLLALLALVLIVAAGIRSGHQRLDNAIEDRTAERAALVERFSLAGDRLYDPAETIELIEQSPFVDDVDPVNDLTLSQFQLSPASDPLVGVALVRRDGTILASRPEPLALRADLLAPALAATAAGDTGLTPSFHLGGELVWARAFPTGGEEPWGAVVMVEGLADGWLQRLYEDLGSLGSGDGGLTLLDAEGVGVASWNPDLLGEQVLPAEVVASIGQGTARWTEPVDGVETLHIVTSRRGPHANTVLMFHQAEHTFAADLRAAQSRRDLVLVGMLLASIGALSGFTWRRWLAIRRDERRAEVILAASDDIIAVVASDGSILSVSAGIHRLLGHQPQDWQGRQLVELVAVDDREGVAEALDRTMRNGQGAVLGVSLVAETGESKWFDMTLVDRRDDERVSGVVVTCSEVTHRKALEESLAHEATHDALTGIANRARLDSYVESHLTPASCGVVGVVDLDRFKALNDELGHDAGDDALRSVASILRTHIDRIGVPARLGGDEFAFAIVGCDDVQLDTLCQALITSIEAIWPGGVDGPNLSASIGVARSDRTAATASTLLREADRAMYAAKAEGGGKWRLVDVVGEASEAGEVDVVPVQPPPEEIGEEPDIRPASATRKPRWTGQRRRDLVSLLMVVAVILAWGRVMVSIADHARTAQESDRVEERFDLLDALASIGASTTSPDRLMELAATVPAEPTEVASAVLDQWVQAPALGDNAVAALLRPDGRTIAAVPADLVLPDELVDGAHWEGVLEGTPAVPPLVEGHDGKLRFHWVLPVTEDGEVVRVLVVGSSVRDNNWSDVQAQVGSLGSFPGGALAVDSNGIASVSWDPAMVGTRVIDPTYLDDIDHGERRRLRMDVEGTQHTVLVVRMPDPYSERYMMWSQATNHLFADLRDGRGTSNLFLIASAALTIVGLALANRRRERLWRLHNGRLHALLQRSSTIVALVDRRGFLTFVSSAAVGHTGFERRQLEGQRIDRLLGPATNTVRQAIEQAVPGTVSELRGMEIPDARSRNRVFDIGIADLTGHPALRGTLLTLRDRTDRQALEDRLRDKATQDPLTGLPNRAAFRAALEEVTSRPPAPDEGASFAVVFIDLDRFKPINDRYGHHVGDEVLRVVAGRLRDHVRADDLVARHGGDEFTILLRESTVEEAQAITDGLLDAVRRPIRVGTLEVTVGASAGVAISDGFDSVSTVIRAADQAMYEAKRGGRDRWAMDCLTAPI